MENSKQDLEKEKMALKRNPEREEHYDKILEEVLLEQENTTQRDPSRIKSKKMERVRI